MDNLQNEQLIRLIQGLLQSQNELIRGLGATVTAPEPSPLDNVWYDIYTALKSAQLRIASISENERAKAAQQATAPLNAKIDELTRDNKILEQEKQVIPQLRNEVADLSDQRSKLEKELSDINANNDALNSANEELINQNRELQNRVDVLTKMSDDLKEKTAELESELGHLNEKNEKAIPVAEEYDKLTAKWKRLMESLLKCSSMKEYCDENRLSSGTMEGMLHFIGLVGDGTGFARTITNTMKRYRRDEKNQDDLTTDEIALIRSVNEFYSEKYGDRLTGDVLFLPEGFSYDKVSGESVRFKADEMQNDRSGPLPVFVCKVLIPGYRGLDGSFDKAVVMEGSGI